jgi:uncharacterized protein
MKIDQLVVDFRPLGGQHSTMLHRAIEPVLASALADRPVVLLVGARQTGKTTLVQQISRPAEAVTYLTLDDLTVLAAARADPVGFVAGLSGRVAIDEVQRAPDLLLSIKAAVDRERKPGRFLLTGSANVLLVPRIADSLVGRMEIVTLWPMSQGELENKREGFIDAVYGDDLPSLTGNGSDLVSRVLRGGFPELATAITLGRRKAWFGSYLATLLQRDIREIADIDGLTLLPRLVAMIATRSMSPLNFADLARSVGIPQTTLKRYMALLESIFLVHELPAWHANIGKRLVKAPRIFLLDSGLLAHLLGHDEQSLREDRQALGPLLETFAIGELKKQSAWSHTQPAMFHFRTHTGSEVDIVLEDARKRLVGIEIKASATAASDDFKGLRSLADAAGKRFHRGIVLYGGSSAVPFGARLHALPISALWRLGATPLKLHPNKMTRPRSPRGKEDA